MRRPARPALALLMLVVLAGCGEQTEPPPRPTARRPRSPRRAKSPARGPARRSFECAGATNEYSGAGKPDPEGVAHAHLHREHPGDPRDARRLPGADDRTHRALRQDRDARARNRDVDPKDADDLERLVGDVFPEGVELDVFSLGEVGLIMCLTGPAATFVVLGPEGDGIRQVLGRGDCTDPRASMPRPTATSSWTSPSTLSATPEGAVRRHRHEGPEPRRADPRHR